MTLDEFIEMVCQRPLPQNPMARARTLAKELAEGAVIGVWDINIRAFRGQISDPDVNAYREARWQGNDPHYALLYRMGYLTEGVTDLDMTPTPAAYAMIEDAEPSSIFISYSRQESSTFALLVLERLKNAGLQPFLDLALEPGENWHEGLKERIQSREYLVLLLGPTTLASVHVVEEIVWALEAGLTLVPIWQPGFQYRRADWPDLPEPVADALTNTHTIRVLEANPLAYNNAIVELLNRFGITL